MITPTLRGNQLRSDIFRQQLAAIQARFKNRQYNSLGKQLLVWLMLAVMLLFSLATLLLLLMLSCLLLPLMLYRVRRRTRRQRQPFPERADSGGRHYSETVIEAEIVDRDVK